MAKQVVKPATAWVPNSTTPRADQAYKTGNRPAGSFSIFSSQEYPVIDHEPTLANQRFVGGPAASDSNDGTNGSPWATWDKAMQEAATTSTWYCLNISGDLTISVSGNNRLAGTGVGSIDQFFIIRKDPNVVSSITFTINATYEIDNKQYWLWDWDGITVTGTAGIWIGQNNQCYYHTVRNMQGATMTGPGGDNIALMYGTNGNLDYFGVFNCDIDGSGMDALPHGNTAGLLAFRSTHMRWENNIVSGFPRPYYFKHGNDAVDGAPKIVIKNCWHREGGTGTWLNSAGAGEISFLSGQKAGGILEISNNIFDGNVEISNGGGGPQPLGHDFFHNTVMGNLTIDYGNDPSQDGTYLNNIIMGQLKILMYNATPSTNVLDYNLYGNENIDYLSDTNWTLAQWQSNSAPAGQDTNSIAGAPAFVGGASPTTIAGFALSGGNGAGAADDGSDMGADVTTVGVAA